MLFKKTFGVACALLGLVCFAHGQQCNDKRILVKNPLNATNSCFDDDDCRLSVLAESEFQYKTNEYESLLEGEERRMLRAERRLYGCTECTVMFGFWYCVQTGHCDRRLEPKKDLEATRNINHKIDSDIYDTCWETLGDVRGHALMHRINTKVESKKRFTVTYFLQKYVCDCEKPEANKAPQGNRPWNRT